MLQVFNTPQKVIVTCNKRLATYLETEVRELGFKPERVFPTGVELQASLNDCIRLNLNLRCASQVLYRIADFKAENPDELYQNLVKIEWEKLIDFSGYFSVTSNVDNPHINTPLFANVKVKDAIVDRIKQKHKIRPDSGPDYSKAVIHLYWRRNEAEVFIDSSGETLAKHSYRKIPDKAPMLEALASACVLASKWDRQSAFVNPMCGSGTLAIEAAMIATKRAPGLLRMNYGFMHILGYDEEVFLAERKRIKEQVIKHLDFKIIASDISENAVDISFKNARTAGVDHLIDFQVCDFEHTDVPQGAKGAVMFNPEYGERLGQQSELEITYKRIGDFMKQQCKGYKGYVFTGNPDLAKKIGLKASRKIEFYNGKLDCRMLEYDLYDGSKREKPREN